MNISEYIDSVNTRYKTGISREHSYRGDLQTLLETILTNVVVTNEPARIECGAPDYILTKNGIPAGFLEAKDIGDKDLDGKKIHKEQFDRYKATRDPFIFTDYLEFHFYLDGAFITSVRIADIQNGSIVPRPAQFEAFRNLITDFVTHTGQTIRSASKLSKMMAGKARLLADIIEKALNSDENAPDGQVNEVADNTLREQFIAFKNVLIHDINAKTFSGIYAQTIAYGMKPPRLFPKPIPFCENYSSTLPDTTWTTASRGWLMRWPIFSAPPT